VRSTSVPLPIAILKSSSSTSPHTAAVVVAIAGMMRPATSLALSKSVGGIA
jgi:hypothetical protein